MFMLHPQHPRRTEKSEAMRSMPKALAPDGSTSSMRTACRSWSKNVRSNVVAAASPPPEIRLSGFSPGPPDVAARRPAVARNPQWLRASDDDTAAAGEPIDAQADGGGAVLAALARQTSLLNTW